jgi:hypothetical protein
MSGNSVHGNDENLLEITNCPRLGQLYLAEFLRLFEHYRARLAFETHRSGDSGTFQLTKDNSWSKDWYEPGSKANSRVAMVQPLAGEGTGSPKAPSPARIATRRRKTKKS